VRRVRWITLVVGEDRRQIEAFSGLAEELSGTREARRNKLAEITARRDEVERERISLRKAEKDKEALHASVRKQKAEREKAIRRLREETERLEGLIVSLEKKRTMAVERERRGLYSLDKAIGMLRWPVDGRVITTFGSRVDPDLGTRIESNGIDIRAERGAAVRSVAPGRVEFSDWWQSYGKMVIVSHSAGYYSLYSHLSRVLIPVGSDVKEGDVIGEVGDTGSLNGPVLHFEIRKGRKALDPLAYLRKR
jgi:murein DD-endopeptidase MepM/ murein hydrolase activator NlpD